MNKTIEEIKKAKRDLESAISKLICDFGNENGVSISSIEIQNNGINLGIKQLVLVKAEIEL